MTDRPCPLCSASLAPGAEICGGCAQRLRNQLRAVPELLAELDLAITKQTTAGGQGLGGSGLDFDPVASEAAVALRLCLHGWARVWDEETPRDVTAGGAERDRALSSAAGQAGLLAGARLASRPWAPEVAEEVRQAVTRAWAAVDRPPDTEFVGWCPDDCGAALYAAQGAAQTRCRACGAPWDVQASRDSLLAAAVDVLAPAATLARALGVEPATLRQWRRRGQLVPAEVTTDGRPLYRVADVQALRARG
jgi:hypothetical protein